eukprot:1156938-Pelagomonas_calceolata.AAC.2
MDGCAKWMESWIKQACGQDGGGVCVGSRRRAHRTEEAGVRIGSRRRAHKIKEACTQDQGGVLTGLKRRARRIKESCITQDHRGSHNIKEACTQMDMSLLLVCMRDAADTCWCSVVFAAEVKASTSLSWRSVACKRKPAG